MFVCPVPKISQVMMKRRRRASHLGRFTLWHNGRRATQACRFTLRRNGRRATKLGRFTLQHNGRRNFLKVNVFKDSAKTFSKLLKYVRYTKIQQTFKRWTLYEDRIKDLGKRLRTHESPRELVRQSEAKRKQAPQNEANVCRRRWQMTSRKKHPY